MRNSAGRPRGPLLPGGTGSRATASDVAGFRWRCANASQPATRRGPASCRLLVLLRLLAVFGLGLLLRQTGHRVGVVLAGLRGLVGGFVGLVLRGFAHGDLLSRGRRGTPPAPQPRFGLSTEPTAPSRGPATVAMDGGG